MEFLNVDEIVWLFLCPSDTGWLKVFLLKFKHSWHKMLNKNNEDKYVYHILKVEKQSICYFSVYLTNSLMHFFFYFTLCLYLLISYFKSNENIL